jgi:hypothetical protein
MTLAAGLNPLQLVKRSHAVPQRNCADDHRFHQRRFCHRGFDRAPVREPVLEAGRASRLGQFLCRPPARRITHPIREARKAAERRSLRRADARPIRRKMHTAHEGRTRHPRTSVRQRRCGRCRRREYQEREETNQVVEMLLLVKEAGAWKIAAHAWDRVTADKFLAS